MPPTLAQRTWVQDALQVIKLSDHQEIEEATRKDSLRGEIASGVRKIEAQVGLMALAVRTFFNGYKQGLHTFGVAMQDAPMDEKEATTAADIAFKIFLTLAGAAFPEAALAEKLGEKAAASIKEITTGALEKGRDLVKSAAKPAERTFRGFAKALGDASVADQAAMEAAVLKGGESVKEAFGLMATAAGTTEGPAGTFMGVMMSASQSFTDRLNDSGDPNQLEGLFAAEFAGKAGQTIPDGPIGPTRATGTLYFEITTVTSMRAEKPDFFLGSDTDKTWKLVAMGNKRDAEGSARALLESFKTPWKISLPRKVRIDLYDTANERDRKMCGGWLVFNKGNAGTTPDSVEDADGSYGGWDTGRKPLEWLMLAWSSAVVRAAAISNAELVGAVT